MDNKIKIDYAKKTNKWFYYIAIESLLCLFLSLFLPAHIALIFFILLISALLAYRMKNNSLYFLIFIFIFYCNYSICVMNYLDKTNYIFTTYRDTLIGTMALQILLFFMLSLYIMLPKDIKQSNVKNMYSEKKITPIAHVCFIVIFIAIMLLGYNSNGFGQRGSYSTIFGYAPILLFLGIYFSRRDKRLLTIYLFLGLIYIFENFAYGERAFALQVMILLYLYFMPDKIKKNYFVLAVLAVVGYFGLTLIGELRAENIDIASALYTSLKNCVKRLFSLDTACSSFYTSQTFINQTMIDSIPQRLLLFIMFIGSIFVGGSILPNANLSQYTHKYFMHWFGGVFPFYGYYYLGYFGVLIFALYIVFIIKKCNKNKPKELAGVVLIYTTMTCFTWYLYAPSSITRGVMLIILCYYAIVITNKIFYKIFKVKKCE